VALRMAGGGRPRHGRGRRHRRGDESSYVTGATLMVDAGKSIL